MSRSDLHTNRRPCWICRFHNGAESNSKKDDTTLMPADSFGGSTDPSRDQFARRRLRERRVANERVISTSGRHNRNRNRNRNRTSSHGGGVAAHKTTEKCARTSHSMAWIWIWTSARERRRQKHRRHPSRGAGMTTEAGAALPIALPMDYEL